MPYLEPRDELKLTTLNLDQGVWGQIREVARREERSANGLCRLWLKEGLERHLARIERLPAA